MSATDNSLEIDYLTAFTDLVAARKLDLAATEITPESTRRDLGIGSLDVIMLILEYIGDRQVELRPEWVSELETVAGICTVFHRIDQAAADA
ncbi:phosphopantetheine-binding protein [Nocardia thailandica]|uniref:phosphopantetheine-binding protein n=1 Tax=Nocardia thailandica TaxID=257275 RepID=UPI0002EE1B83|nr:phosphopantetheine-binding protein [Nocardia thailandica]